MRPAGVQAFEKRTGNRSEIYAYEQRKGAKLSGAYEKTVSRQQEGLGILPGAAALVSEDSKLVGDQRQEEKRRD